MRDSCRNIITLIIIYTRIAIIETRLRKLQRKTIVVALMKEMQQRLNT